MIFLNGGDDGSWGVFVIAAMLLAPCVIGRAMYFWDRRREGRSTSRDA